MFNLDIVFTMCDGERKDQNETERKEIPSLFVFTFNQIGVKPKVLKLIDRGIFVQNSIINYSTLDDWIKTFNTIESTQDIIIIIDTKGGDVAIAEAICKLIKQHKGKVTAVVERYAYSAGTLIALCCDEIIVSQGAIFSQIDPQMVIQPENEVTHISGGAIIEAFNVMKEIGNSWITTKEIITKIRADKAFYGIVETIKNNVNIMPPENYNPLTDPSGEILRKYKEDALEKICEDFVYGKNLHAYPFLASELQQYHINIKIDSTRVRQILRKEGVFF